MASFGPRIRYKGWLEPIGHTIFFLKAIHRFIRTNKLCTILLGPQYKRSRDFIEIDITYDCNLKCLNCNRSCRQAPSQLYMKASQIELFIKESQNKRKQWKRIRILGGEPTMHPDLLKIIEMLRSSFQSDGTVIELATNGLSAKTKEMISSLPSDILIDNSEKTGIVNEHFGAFNVAPLDLAHFQCTSFSNGCQIAQLCGMGLTPFGYYCCAIAGGIDRVVGYNIGHQELPDDDDPMQDHFEKFCPLCGRFTSGHFIPWNFRKTLQEELISLSWQKIYTEYSEKIPNLTFYGSQKRKTNDKSIH
ncbi:MAG: radical SAM protein [Candidatus Brocadiae bacterium]|nr:radical SAM protein [Candidatus Brocadiia bacterium]